MTPETIIYVRIIIGVVGALLVVLGGALESMQCAALGAGLLIVALAPLVIGLLL